MVESTATIRLTAVDTNVVTTINNVSTASTNALLGATALAGGFRLLEKASSTSVAQMAIGAEKAQLLNNSFGTLANSSNQVTQALGKLSNAAFIVQQLAIAADGVGRAAEKYARLPQAMQAMQASGVSTYSIQQFNQLTEAIRGSDVALDSLLVNSIAELGEFEKAAARAGTILKSSLRFDEAGNPLTANAEERLANAIAAQKLVNSSSINNAVTSSEALRGQYEVLSSGFTNQAESQEVLEQGLKLIGIGRAGGAAVDTTATLQLLTKTLNAYELSAEDAAKTAAILNATVENGLTTIQELSQGFGATSAQASKANISLVDTAAAVSVLTAQGTSTAESLTGIARVSANIINKTPEAEKELAKLQIRGEKIRFDKAEIQAKGFTQALIDLYDAAGGSSEVLTKIFPEDVAYRTVNALLTEQGNRLASTKEAIAGADETKLNEIFEVAQSDRTARFLRLANRFKESIIEIGISLAPTLEPGIKALETIANKFAGLPEPVRKAIGSYLAFRIQSKAVGSAAGELIKTLVSLATNYLLVRTISLALTGQLGKEASAIKSLITQKKGLAAATLQLFGIDQKWRLEQETATAAIAKQGKVAQAAASAKSKASEITKNVATTAIAKTSGITKEQVKEELERRKQQAIAAYQVGSAKAKEYAQKVADKYGFDLPTVISQPPQKPIALLPPAGGTSGVYPTPKPEDARVVRNVIPPPAVPKPSASAIALNKLIAKDADVITASNQYSKVKDDYNKAQGTRQQALSRQQKALQNVNQAEVALTDAKNKAIASTTNRTQALNQVQQQQQKLTAAQNVLATRELELTNANTAALVNKNRLVAAETSLEQARYSAKAKYAPLAQAITVVQEAEAKAIALNEAAKVARLKAEQAEIALGSKSKITMLLKRDAYLAETLATYASTAATEAKNVATSLETKLTAQQRLAELGLYETTIFGNKVKLASTGLMGGINKFLTANIALTKAATVAEQGYGAAKSGVVAIAQKILAFNIPAAGKGIFNFIKDGAVKSGSAIQGLLSPLGALAPLFGVGAIAAIALRSELFGLGKDARKLSKDYKEFLKEQQKLNVSLEKRAGLTAVEGLLNGNSQSNDLVNQKLIALKDSGALTQTQFNKLATALNKTAAGGDKAKESLAKLRAEIKQVKADAVEIEKGIVSKTIEAVKKIPSLIGGGIDNVLTSMALVGNTVPNLLMGRGFTSFGDIKQAREADKLIEPLSILNKIQVQASDRFYDTKLAITDYQESLALTSEVQAKVAQGVKLTSADLANEDVAFKNRADKNRAVIEQLEKQITANQDIADKTKNEENKQLLENQIQQTIRQKEALEAENEALKKLQEDTKKYLTETLPAIQTSLKENANPLLALTNAQEQFDQTFLLDGEGKATKLLKPIEVLRDEAGKLVGQIQENLSFGLFDNVGLAAGEAVAAEQLRDIRDNQISFIEDGKTVTGYRLTLGQRRELTASIIELDNQDLKRAEEKNKIEISLAQTLGQAKLETAEATNLKIAELETKAIADRITQKENEIAEFKALGLRTIDLEIQLEQLQVQQRSQGFGLNDAKLQQKFAQARFELQEQELLTQKLIANSQQRVAIATEENAILNLNFNNYQQRIQVEEKLVSISSTISQNQVFNAQNQLDLARSKQATLQESLPLEREQLKIQIANTAEQNKQQLLNAQQALNQAKLQVTEAKETLRQARRNDASKEQLDRLKLQVEQAGLQSDRAEESLTQAEFQVILEEEISVQKLEQFETSKQLENINAAIATSQATLAATEAKITKEYQLQSQAIDGRSQRAELRSQEFNSILSFRSGELNLAGQLASSEKEKQKIAQQTAALKLRSLKTQITSEAEILSLNQQQARLKLKSESIATGAKLEQNFADILKVQANIDTLKSTGASKAEVEAEEKQLSAAIAGRQALFSQQQQQIEEENLLKLSQNLARNSFKRQSILNVDTARVEAINTLPEAQQKQAAKILFEELRSKAKVGDNPNVSTIVDSLRNFKIQIPEIRIPEIKLPDLDSIRQDVRSLVSEFNVGRNPNTTSNALNTYEGEGRKFVIQNLTMDSPINITIAGEDKEGIAQQVEGVVNNKLIDIFSEMEQQLNNY